MSETNLKAFFQNIIFGKTLHSYLPFDSIPQHKPILFVLIFVFQICFDIPLRHIGDDEQMIDQWSWLLVIQICPSLFEYNPSPPSTVGQEAVELICQSERKTQQNATISLWPLFSTEMDLILM